MEARLAGPFLNYLGLLALLIGVALLIGYWMESHAVRALALAWLSAGLLGALSRLVRARGSHTLSLTLEGSGLGLTLVGCYLSYRWLGLAIGLVAAAAITLYAMRRAMQRGSQLLASFALLAALLAPLLLRSARSGEGLVFGYLAVVNAGAVWAGHRQGWIRLRFLALMASHLAAWFWYLNHPGATLALTVAFPVVTFALFAAIVPAAEMNFSEGLLGVLNSGGFLAAAYSILRLHATDLAPWAPLGLGGMHALIGFICWQSGLLVGHLPLHGWLAGHSWLSDSSPHCQPRWRQRAGQPKP